MTIAAEGVATQEGHGIAEHSRRLCSTNGQALGVVKGDVLLSCATHGIVVLSHAQCLLQQLKLRQWVCLGLGVFNNTFATRLSRRHQALGSSHSAKQCGRRPHLGQCRSVT